MGGNTDQYLEGDRVAPSAPPLPVDDSMFVGRAERMSGSIEELSSLEAARRVVDKYTPGQFLPAHAETANFRVPSTTRIALVGPSGAGKSALANTLYRVVRDQTGPLDPICHISDGSATTGTRCVQCVGLTNQIQIFDTPGLVPDDNRLHEWAAVGLRDGELALRAEHPALAQTLFDWGTYERVDCFVFVFNVTAPSAAFRELFHSAARKNQRPVVALLGLESIANPTPFIHDFAGALGVDVSSIFPVHVYHHAAPDRTILTDLEVLRLLCAALRVADRGLPVKACPDDTSTSTCSNLSLFSHRCRTACNQLGYAKVAMVLGVCAMFLKTSWMGKVVLVGWIAFVTWRGFFSTKRSRQSTHAAPARGPPHDADPPVVYPAGYAFNKPHED
mmetsp:Transcript_3464/g.8264  ORF Transcript_3464/g.8264 Transcript_3464/m.8264 type:complete len:390 (+) Transcript_3464:71-1240(+)